MAIYICKIFLYFPKLSHMLCTKDSKGPQLRPFQYELLCSHSSRTDHQIFSSSKTSNHAHILPRPGCIRGILHYLPAWAGSKGAGHLHSSMAYEFHLLCGRSLTARRSHCLESPHRRQKRAPSGASDSRVWFLRSSKTRSGR